MVHILRWYQVTGHPDHRGSSFFNCSPVTVGQARGGLRSPVSRGQARDGLGRAQQGLRAGDRGGSAKAPDVPPP